VDAILGFAVGLARELSSGKSTVDTGDGAAASDAASDVPAAAKEGGAVVVAVAVTIVVAEAMRLRRTGLGFFHPSCPNRTQLRNNLEPQI
jgi:hypothetical protein